ncbi:MAG: flagellar motor switch protein FliM [Candidatus Solibacter sp.]
MARQLTQPEIDEVFQKATGTPNAESAIASFDFRRPDRIAKSQVQAIRMLHESFVRNLASSLSAYLRSYLTVNLISVEQLSYGEFLEGLAAPTYMASLSLSPYDGSALIELNPTLIFPIIEIILGGKGRVTTNLKREVTVIEQNLLETLFRIILSDLKEAWKSVTLIDFKIQAVTTEPQRLQIVASNEVVVAVSIEIRIGEITGTLNLAIPSINIKMIGNKFDQQWSLRKTEATEAEQQRAYSLIRTSKARLDARLRGPTLRVRDLLDLQAGDLLQLDYRLDQLLDCDINGTAKFRGGVVNSNQKKAFVIESMPEAR